MPVVDPHALTSVARMKIDLRFDAVNDYSDQDDLLRAAINSATFRIHAFTGRSVMKNDPGGANEVVATEYHDGDGLSTRLFVREWPVFSVTTVKESGSTLSRGTDYLLNEAEGVLLRAGATSIKDAGSQPYAESAKAWKKGAHNLYVSYVPGWDENTIPPEIEEAAVRLTFAYLNTMSVSGTASATMGSMSVSPDWGMPPDVKEILAPYKIARIGREAVTGTYEGAGRDAEDVKTL